jgi:hypothetical protein
MMIQHLRALERQLVCLRAQVLLEPVTEGFAEVWERAMAEGAPLPDDLDLVHAALAQGVPTLRPNPPSYYLQGCKQDRSTPEPHRLVELIVHGYALSRLLLDTGEARCKCIAHQLLVPPNPVP